MALRVYLTSWTNMCFIIGQLIAAGVLRGCLEREDEWGFRIPFAIQWIWPAILIPLLCFAPESPWHLVRQKRVEEAEKSLRRLQRASAQIDVKQTLATIIYTNSLEEELSVGTSYWDCFSGFELRRTEIACLCFAGQVLSGSTFACKSSLGFSTFNCANTLKDNASYFFEQVGLQTSTVYNLNLGGTALALVGTFVNWFALMPYFGRRTVYIVGMFAMACILYLIGILNVWNSRESVGLTQAVLTLAWTFCFQLSAGQLGWALPAEMGSTRLRQKTIVLARNSYYVVAVISNVLQPYFMNPTAWNLRGYTGFVWGTTAFATFAWAYFRLPETRNRTYEQLDILFAKQVPARQFEKTEVNAFDEHQAAELARKYSVANLDEKRPSIVPSVSRRVASISGRDAAYGSQRNSLSQSRKNSLAG
jgi:MFS transporter, SP family, general alpha glucoside:H+ symporter